MAKTLTKSLMTPLILLFPLAMNAGNPMFFAQNQMPVTGGPPTFIQEAETTWNAGSTSKTTASFNVQAGDTLIAYGGIENEQYTLSISGGSLTWTQLQSIDLTDYAEVRVWAATVDTNKSMTVTFTSGNSSSNYGGNVLTFRNTGGVGASSKANANGAAPSLNLTTTKANSAIVVFTDDWNALDGSSRTWRTGASALTETTYDYVGGQHTVYGGYHANAGAIGTKTVGLSAPGGQKYSIVAVEVRGP